MRILVTGGTGYIGGRLVALLDSWDRCSRINLLTRREVEESGKRKVYLYDGTIGSMTEAVAESDLVIHLAAVYKTGKDSATVQELLESNVVLSTQLLQAVAETSPAAGVSVASTFSSFNHAMEYSPSTFYDASKYAVEVLAEALKVKAAFLRFPDTYGPHDSRKKVHNLLRDAVLRGDEQFTFQKPSYQLMNMIHVDDLIKGVIISAEHMARSTTPELKKYDLFYPENNITLGEIADEIIAGSSTTVQFPLFGEVSSLPLAQNFIPGLDLNHDPQKSLHKALFLKENP